MKQAKKTPPKKSPSSTPLKQQSLLSFFSPPPTKKTETSTPAEKSPAFVTPQSKPAQIETTPKTASKPAPSLQFTPKESPKKMETEAPQGLDSDDSDDDIPLAKKRKRLTQTKKKSIVVSDDEEAEWDNKDVDMESSDDSVSLADSESEDEKPMKKKPAQKQSKAPTKTPPKKTPTKTVTPDKGNEESSIAAPSSGATKRQHETWPWLQKDRRDKQGRKPDHPEYDSRTLQVPADFLRKETPAMQQWWEVKMENMDTVLFFKVGKFYELFHMDADVGFKELDLNYMKGEKAHSGFPESAYGKFSGILVSRGYRVARVEQTETPEMMKARGGKSKVVRREICSLLTPGTNTISFLDGSPAGPFTTSTYLLTIKEQLSPELEFGVCLVDCSTGSFRLGQFTDSPQRDRLRTLLAQFQIVEIVVERHGLSQDTKSILNHGATNAVKTELKAGTEMWDAVKTIRELKQADYFSEFPQALLEYIDSNDQSVKANGTLAISALGGCVWNLRRSLIDQELLSLRQFSTYNPPDKNAGGGNSKSQKLTQQYVVLDGHTIYNLELLRNNYNGQRQGSLLDQLDKTVSNFGKRLFEDWLLKPLCSLEGINARLDAIEELIPEHTLVVEIRSILKNMPDLERLLSRIHALGVLRKDHPDSRAIMYESATYNVRKIKDFVSVLSGFQASQQIVKKLKGHPWKSKLMKHWIESFPDLTEKLKFFDNAFDKTTALKTGTIQPQDGVDPEYDESIAEVAEIEKELEDYLQEQRKVLKCKTIVYWGTKKDDRYQLEVPESAVASKQPSEYELKSKKKGFKRFHSEFIRSCLARLNAAEDRRENALKDTARRMFANFDKSYLEWKKAIQQLATLDCLMSLSLVSGLGEGYTRPTFVDDEEPFLEIEEGRHPSIASTLSDFIPNDTYLGKTKGNMMLLSGPNMGGKSTLLRQTCTLVLMAQMGCFVPAQSCKLTPVDRIFTRLGASDRILAGQSTLFVELAETATILNHASKHSLVILDELGRGTSTFDGTAIAYGVVEHLLNSTGCRTMFATHYHSLVEEYIEDKKVVLGHMECMVDPENEQKVVFLYKLADGICPKSYGLNVAMLADLPQQVIEVAGKKSQQFEESLLDSHFEMQIRKAVEEKDVSRLRQLWTAAQ